MAGSTYLEGVVAEYRENNASSGLQIGALMRFPAFTSATMDAEVARTAGGVDILYIISIAHDIGVDISAVSYFDEQEVLICAPSSFQIDEVEMNERNQLIIRMHSVENDFVYF